MACECDKLLDRIVRKFKKNKKDEKRVKMPKISRKRSLLKGITWESMCFFFLGSMVYYLTGKWEDVTFVVVTYHLCKVVLYFFHERFWNKVSWGITSD